MMDPQRRDNLDDLDPLPPSPGKSIPPEDDKDKDWVQVPGAPRIERNSKTGKFRTKDSCAWPFPHSPLRRNLYD